MLRWPKKRPVLDVEKPNAADEDHTTVLWMKADICEELKDERIVRSRVCWRLSASFSAANLVRTRRWRALALDRVGSDCTLSIDSQSRPASSLWLFMCRARGKDQPCSPQDLLVLQHDISESILIQKPPGVDCRPRPLRLESVVLAFAFAINFKKVPPGVDRWTSGTASSSKNPIGPSLTDICPRYPILEPRG